MYGDLNKKKRKLYRVIRIFETVQTSIKMEDTELIMLVIVKIRKLLKKGMLF